MLPFPSTVKYIKCEEYHLEWNSNNLSRTLIFFEFGISHNVSFVPKI